ncbi:MAG: molecular chaperone DjlA [Gammaproteobacteria bacterium RIFCSPHIGHO2_12_FULL_40_19]|nr:MAG: molecular chaperone DjlA [Gammaproteobacteria bacterium RIFCSPHIGHO2_12_FULL_40_19]
MKFRGKFIGAMLGLLIAGPIGMALGFIAGHLYDLGYFRAFLQAVQGNIHTQSQQVFFNATFKIMGYVAKSDGRVSENEIRTAQMIMSKMGLNEALRKQAIHLFSEGKESDFNLNQALYELRQVCRIQPALLQIFLDIQLQMASADGHLSPAKKATLQHICEQLGIAGFQFHQNENQYQQQHQYQHHHQYGRKPTQSDAMSLNDAYKMLGISESATPEEIKKAYRRSMSQNHPDKLIAKGLPPEMIKVATQKTQRIKQAYEQIKNACSL